MFDKTTELTRLVLVAEHGNILGAAEQLGLSQPALSYTISLLEQRLGAPLFERAVHSKQSITLTPLGEAATQSARRILREIETAKEELEALLAGSVGTLRVAAGTMLMQAVMPTAISQFHADYPDVEVDLSAAGGADALRSLTAGESDLYCGPLAAESLPQFLVHQPLPGIMEGIVAHRDHPLQAHAPSWNDLANYPWIDYGGAGEAHLAGDNPSFAAFLAELHSRTGRHVKSLVRSGPACLFLMETGPYLARLPLQFLDRLPGQFLKALPVKFGMQRFSGAIVSRRAAESWPAFSRLRELITEAATA